MRFFWKKEKPLTGSQERLAARLASRMLLAQQKLANALNVRTAGFSARRWWVLLAAFCLLFGGYSLYLLLAAIY